MHLRFPLLALVSLVLASCAGPTAPAQATATLASFTSGAWTLKVTRAWDGGTGAPVFPLQGSLSDYALDESGYKTVTDGPDYRLTLADAGRYAGVSARIGGPAEALIEFVGERGRVTRSSVQYDVPPSGTFTGARLIVWETAQGLQGEWTVYGSGVAITKSERGAVVSAQ